MGMHGASDNRGPDSRALEALADPCRRQLLLALFEHDRGEALDPSIILRRERPIDDPDAAAIRLQHVHLPKLADAAFVEWDRESGTVSRGPNWGRVAPLLRLLSQQLAERPDERVWNWSSGE